MTDCLDISVHTRTSHVLVCLRGECDITTAPKVRAALADQAHLNAALIVADLAELAFLDAAGIHALVDARIELAANQKRLVLSSPQKFVTRVLQLTGTDQLISVHQSLTTP